MNVLPRVSIAVIELHDHKQPGEETVYFSLQDSGRTLLLREVRAGNWRQELMQRPH